MVIITPREEISKVRTKIIQWLVGYGSKVVHYSRFRNLISVSFLKHFKGKDIKIEKYIIVKILADVNTS